MTENTIDPTLFEILQLVALNPGLSSKQLFDIGTCAGCETQRDMNDRLGALHNAGLVSRDLSAGGLAWSALDLDESEFAQRVKALGGASASAEESPAVTVKNDVYEVFGGVRSKERLLDDEIALINQGFAAMAHYEAQPERPDDLDELIAELNRLAGGVQHVAPTAAQHLVKAAGYLKSAFQTAA